MHAAFKHVWLFSQSLLSRPRAIVQFLRRQRIRRTPTVLEVEGSECGAAALAMVLAYYGLWIPIEQLRVACGVSRDGSKASNILRAARRFGFVAKGFKKDPATLNELPMPCIIHWNFNHFVVLEGLDRKRAFINDPAIGRRTIGLDELDASFTGVVLAMEPSATFRKAGRRPNFLHILARELQHSKLPIALLLLVSLALVVPGIVIPSFSKIFVDQILVGHSRDWIMPLLIGMAVAALSQAIITALQQSLLLRLETKLAVAMVSRFLFHLFHLPMEFFAQRRVGDLASRVEANETIARLLSNGLATNSLNLVAVLFFAVAMASYDAELAAICVGTAILNVFALKLAAGGREDIVQSLALKRGKLNDSMTNIVSTIETLKASGLEDDAFARWAGFQARVLNEEQKLGLYSAVLDICPTFFNAVMIAAALSIGGSHVIEGSLTIGELVAFLALAPSFARPISTLVSLAGDYQTIKGDLFRLEDVFNYPMESRQASALPSSPGWNKLVGRVTLVDIQFGYSPLDPPLIDGLSLEMEPGMRVALVGASGSGKSTLGRLIAGLHTPTTGHVRFDNRPLPAISPEVFANSVAYVDQDIFLFEGTVRENLTLWDPTISEADISQALKDALIHDEIMTRPLNYDCHVAEGGTNFSGGQRQRIEIARALVGNPSVLILDEATSALDPATEKAIDDNLRRRGCTCIIIAHRLSTIRDCDEIIVLRSGKVLERGTHEQLLAKGDAYAGLVSQR